LVPSAGSAGQFLKHDASWGTPPDTTANETITLSGDVSGTGTNAITCTIADATTSAAGLMPSADKTKLDACMEVDDTSSLNSKSWSAAKIISNSLAVMGLGYLHPVDKYTVAIKWEMREGITESGWSRSAYSGAWGASQSHSAFAQTSTTGSGTGALFSVTTDSGGIPTFTWVTGGFDYEVGDTLTFNDPYLSGESASLYVSEVTPASEGVSWTGTTGSMVCAINHGLDTEYITISMRNEDGILEVGSDWTDSEITVIDEDNITLEYLGGDYPAVGEDKFITIIG
jgi:hypothetical protein